jgi:hypothetical protein
MALAALTFSSMAPAHAQIAGAIGKPLPVASDAAGQVIVRVVNGDPSAPAGGLDVTLELGAGPRVSRTAADGRATFAAVPAGAEAIVKIPGKDGELTSQPFTMPSSGGVRVLMSTTGAFGGSGGGSSVGTVEAGGGPMSGGESGAQPSLRQRSGGAIVISGTPATSLAIRLSYDDAADAMPPKNHPVHFVSYSFDDKISLVTKNSDAEGRVTFDGLDVSGATAYFAMTLLPRGETFERLLSGPLLMPGSAGLAMVLSAEKRTSPAPAVDDLFTLQRFEGKVPAGQVLIEAQGDPELGVKVTLRDVATGNELLASTLAAPPTGADGKPGEWPAAIFDVSKQIPGQLVYAEGQMKGQRFRSLPFQLVPDRGARASLLVGPRVMTRFSLTSVLDEDYFVFRGRFQLANNSWFPYKHSEDGLLFPLPVGASGAQVTEEDAAEISPVPGEGLRLLRPLPPGGKTFVAGWSMPTKNSEVRWDLELPFGTSQSGMEIMQPPGVTVELPPGVEGRTVQVAKGSYFILPDISIRPNQRMVMTIRGLPAAPAWKLWLPRIVGGLAMIILIGGLVFAFRRGGADGADAEENADKAARAKIDELMDELVSLEGKIDDKSTVRRAEVMTQLERLWPTGAATPAADADAKASA